MKAYIVESAELRKNLDNIKKRAGSAVIYAVLKGNGYGLGLIPMAAACRDAGITRYAVTESPTWPPCGSAASRMKKF